MYDVSILRLDSVCWCKICDCLLFEIWDGIIDIWIWKYD